MLNLKMLVTGGLALACAASFAQAVNNDTSPTPAKVGSPAASTPTKSVDAVMPKVSGSTSTHGKTEGAKHSQSAASAPTKSVDAVMPKAPNDVPAAPMNESTKPGSKSPKEGLTTQESKSVDAAVVPVTKTPAQKSPAKP